jgi:predicted site-specific integrase-resolvase
MVEIRGKKYLAVAEAASRCGRDSQTIRRWLKEGAVQGHKDNSGRWLVDLVSLEAYLEGGS